MPAAFLDTLTLLLHCHRVPYYWLTWPEDPTLIAHQLDGNHYRVNATISKPAPRPSTIARWIWPISSAIERGSGARRIKPPGRY